MALTIIDARDYYQKVRVMNLSSSQFEKLLRYIKNSEKLLKKK